MLFFTSPIFGAKAPVKFGKVSQEELEMTVYEPDTSAAAVVLCNYGKFNGSDLKFISLRRVKVLKKSGTGYAEFVIYANENTTFRGKTYNLENGEVVQTKLKRESIFKERVFEDNYRYHIAMPNVKVGTVFEIEESRLGLPREWAFQEMIPVKHNELILEESTYIKFRKKMLGFEHLTSSDNDRYVAIDMPAFKREAYMSSPNNYITKFEFDLLNISYPGYYKSFTTTWEAVNERLLNNTYFGVVIRNGSGYLSDIKKEIEATCQTDLEKARAAFYALKDIKWDDYTSLYTSNTSMGPVFKKGVGNSTDLNVMLLQLLKKLDIKVYPVAMSTRSHGMLNPFYPSFGKLNYMMVCALIDDKEYLLDATEKNMPFGMLPKRCLNQQRRLVNNNQGKWVNLTTSKENKKYVYPYRYLNSFFMVTQATNNLSNNASPIYLLLKL
ncbi:hypothetical protein DMA11_04125 [Marinilabiliaceae bacterium JC017]|nr:hypothetical protein DMA11_04125 [Marinilabiliaceae bacterium JC017]